MRGKLNSECDGLVFLVPKSSLLFSFSAAGHHLKHFFSHIRSLESAFIHRVNANPDVM